MHRPTMSLGIRTNRYKKTGRFVKDSQGDEPPTGSAHGTEGSD